MEKYVLVLSLSLIVTNICSCSTLPDAPKQQIVVRTEKQEFVIFKNERKNWFGALHFCKRHNMELANIDNNMEHFNLIGAIKDNHIWTEYWIGGNFLEHGDINEGHWVSNGKKFTYTNWGPGQPDNYNSTEQCVHLICLKCKKGEDYDGWNDQSCKRIKPFICSRGISEYIPQETVMQNVGLYFDLSNKVNV